MRETRASPALCLTRGRTLRALAFASFSRGVIWPSFITSSRCGGACATRPNLFWEAIEGGRRCEYQCHLLSHSLLREHASFVDVLLPFSHHSDHGLAGLLHFILDFLPQKLAEMHSSDTYSVIAGRRLGQLSILLWRYPAVNSGSLQVVITHRGALDVILVSEY